MADQQSNLIDLQALRAKRLAEQMRSRSLRKSERSYRPFCYENGQNPLLRTGGEILE